MFPNCFHHTIFRENWKTFCWGIPVAPFHDVLFFWGAKRITAEDPTNIGRIDLVLEEDNHLYVIECK